MILYGERLPEPDDEAALRDWLARWPGTEGEAS